MKTFSVVNSFAAMLFFFLTPSASVPSQLIGKWKVGRPYGTPGIIGITDKQENHIRHFGIRYSSASLTVCGKEISITKVERQMLTKDQFLKEVGISPRSMGMGESNVTEITMNWPNNMNACGDISDPGTDVLIGKNGHIVIEVAGEFLPLERM